MRAVVVTDQAVEVQDIKKPEPKPNEVLVQVRACGLNRADLMVAGGSWCNRRRRDLSLIHI